MAQITNPRKAFQFTIIVPGLNPFLAQEVDSPDSEIEEVSHGDTNYDVHTAGRVKYGKLNVRKISTAYGPDNWVWDWHFQAMDPFTGGGGAPPTYWRPIVVHQYAINGISIINSEEWLDCWPTKINGRQWKRQASENVIEHIEFSVQRLRRL